MVVPAAKILYTDAAEAWCNHAEDVFKRSCWKLDGKFHNSIDALLLNEKTVVSSWYGLSLIGVVEDEKGWMCWRCLWMS